MVDDTSGKERSKTATRSCGGGKVEEWGGGAKKVEIEGEEDEVPVVSKEVKTKTVKEVGTGNAKAVGTENSEEMKRGLKGNDIADTIPPGSGAAEPEAGTQADLLKYAIKKYCFTWDSSSSDLGDEFELEAAYVLTEKANLVLADLP